MARQQIALLIFLFGIMASITYTPLTHCYRLGRKGAVTEESYCKPLGRHLIWEWPRQRRSQTDRILIDKTVVITDWIGLSIFSILLGLNYRAFFRPEKGASEE